MRSPRRHAFALLEVIVAITILAITVAAVMRSFTQSVSALRTLEIRTHSTFLAQRLMEEYELVPPSEGVSEGDFPDFPNYSYMVDVEYLEPEYDDHNRHEDIDQFYPNIYYTIDIWYDHERLRQPMKALTVDSAVIGFERFTNDAKQAMGDY